MDVVGLHVKERLHFYYMPDILKANQGQLYR
jgi:hypothetical protein